MRSRRIQGLGIVLLMTALGGCQHKDAGKRYPMEGQILSVDPARQELTISHGDIPNLMPGMTMTYPVATAALMNGRAPGETIKAVLEVQDSSAKIVDVTHVGSKPLPDSPNKAGMASGVLDVGDAVPDTALIDQSNKRRSLSEWKGASTVITFTYTHCPLANFCPLMDQNFLTLQRRLADDTILRGHVKLISVTFDPTRDTPDVLAAHAAKLKADLSVWTFLTGDAPTVERFAGKFGIGVIRDEKDVTDITHNLRTAIIGPDLKIAKIYSGNDWTPGAVLTDLRAIQNTAGH